MGSWESRELCISSFSLTFALLEPYSQTSLALIWGGVVVVGVKWWFRGGALESRRDQAHSGYQTGQHRIAPSQVPQLPWMSWKWVGEPDYINSTFTQNTRLPVCYDFVLNQILKLSPQEDTQFNFLCFYFQIIFPFFLSSVVLPSKLTITYFWNRNINR